MPIPTTRLHLRPLEPIHAQHLFDGLQDERLYEFISAEPLESIESLRARYERLAKRKSPDGREDWLNWAVWSIAVARYIGFVQATVRADGVADVAYVLFPDVWGQGLGREAVAAMVRHVRDHYAVTTFRALVDPRNARSIALLLSLGFTQAGYRVGADQIRGVRADECEYLLRFEASPNTENERTAPPHSS